MEKCYVELKEAQAKYDDKKEDRILLKCIKCKKFNKKENEKGYGYFCGRKEIRFLNL
jgi:hypothetical protein